MLIFIETNVVDVIKRVYPGITNMSTRTLRSTLLKEGLFEEKGDIPPQSEWEVEEGMTTIRSDDTVYIFLLV